MCTCEQRTDHGASGPAGRLTPHPWPLSRSAGQTLTLEQMDNGLDALSVPGHTLRLLALAAALPFTSACPPFLLLHPSCSAPDCLNSKKTHELRLRCLFCFGVSFFGCFLSSISMTLRPSLSISSRRHFTFQSITYFNQSHISNHFYSFLALHVFFPLSITTHAGGSFLFSILLPYWQWANIFWYLKQAKTTLPA